MSYKKTVYWGFVIGAFWAVAFLLKRHIFPVSSTFDGWTIFSLIFYVYLLLRMYKENDDLRSMAIGFPIWVVVLLLVEYFFRGFLNIFIGVIGILVIGFYILEILKLLKKTARRLGSLFHKKPDLIAKVTSNIRKIKDPFIKQKAEVSKDDYSYNSDKETNITSDINAKLTSIEEI